MNLNSLIVRQFFQNSFRRQTCGSSPCKISQSSVETISQKGNKNMRLNSLFQLVPDGTDGKTPFQLLKSLFNASQKQIKFPGNFRGSRLHMGTKQIAPLPGHRSQQAFTIQFETKSIFIHRFVRFWQRDTNQSKVSPGFFL